MKNSFLLLIISCCFSLSALAQEQPVKWSFEAKKVSATEYDIICTADLDPGWYIYSQYLKDDLGPVKTALYFNVSEHYEMVGLPKEEGKKTEGHDQLFDMYITKFSGTTQFIQRIKVMGSLNAVSGNIEYMTCDEHKCLPPSNKEFVVSIF